MSTGKDGKLGAFLREASNWFWDDYVRAEHDTAYSSNQGLVLALIRAIQMQKMDAIKLMLNRLDGKLKTPIAVELPKVYYLYPNATQIEIGGVTSTALSPEQGLVLAPPETSDAVDIIYTQPAPDDEVDLELLTIRETLSKMSDFPRDTPAWILEQAQMSHDYALNRGPIPDEIPRVKSVLAASLLVMAQSRDIAAIAEVFDQVDGKLVETLVLGEDIYITDYRKIAPPDAVRNIDGVLQTEATAAQNIWGNVLEKGVKK